MKLEITVEMDKTDKEVKKLFDEDSDEPQAMAKETDHFPEEWESEEDARVLLEAVQIKQNKTRLNKAMEILSNKSRVVKSLTDVKSAYNRIVSQDKQES